MQQLSHPYPTQGCLRARRRASSAICRLQMPETPRLARMLPNSFVSLFPRRWTLPVPRAAPGMRHPFWRSGEEKKKKSFFPRSLSGTTVLVSGGVGPPPPPPPPRLSFERSMCRYLRASERRTVGGRADGG
ncbi:hypothetical protein M441DRAFT_227009 [Trichoderma asperellum CBS 433.97]|uniref:Uncharacterized protein n=1 Tax=Trichoderma asperellum (strain ATCC 204424 / CBS 433.97 / NBRC 101777) TaxID=1042311 RepID=A0A2T3ZQ34_TRIA4|nr:hypothetical protein M441DRAFT_227009 [Trichoderma asperellum CBS 433.97]PTB46911.1 hypothetical protein M441DRAFT_227009 [Trichoderma asperellum CBS 433.97]